MVERKRDTRRGLNFGMVDEEFLYALAQVCSGVQGRVTSLTPWFRKNPEPRGRRMTQSNT